MKLVTYNIHSGVGTDGQQDYQRISQFLQEQDADIVLLQEMDTRPEERTVDGDIAAICGDHFTSLVPSPALNESSGWYGNAVLSRFPVESSKTIDVSQEGYQPRNIQEVVLKTDSGPLRVVNTHKGLKRRERRQQFAMLYEYVHALDENPLLPLIVGGDFNEWQLFTTAFQHMDETLSAHSTSATFPSRWPLFRLDRIWTGHDVDVNNIRVLKNADTRLLSDHLPILLDFQLRRVA